MTEHAANTRDTGKPTDPEQLLLHDAFVRGLARSLVRDEHGANDLVQDTWLAAIESPPENPGSLRAWLGRVVRYLAGKRRRSEARRDHHLRRAARADDYVPSTAEIVEREAARRHVVRAVLELEEPYRATMLLRFFENLPPRDVARRLKVPVETVRTRIKRALAVLRARLDSMHSGDRQAWSLMLLPFIPRPTLAASAGGGLWGTCLGILIMTTKAKLTAVAAVCGVLLAALWALGEPSGEVGPPAGTGRDQASAEMVAAGGEDGTVAAVADQEAERGATSSQRESIAGPTVGSLLVRAIWGDDKKPAAGVLLKAMVLGGGDHVFDAVYRTTDAAGTFLIDNLKPRRMYVQAMRGGHGRYVRTTIVAGEQAKATVEIPPGVNLKGIVVDKAGEPVPGASLIIAGWAGGQAIAIAKTDADGRFSLRSIGTHYHVGARAEGHAPSVLHTIIGSKGGHLEVRIQLTGRGGVLRGKVLDPRGSAVAGAVLEVGKEKRGAVKLPDGGRGKSMMPIRARSGEDGRFRVEGLALGQTPVAVRGQGLAPWRGDAEVLANGSDELVVRLLHGVTLAGTVRDSNAKPAEKVEITVGGWGRLGFQRTKTDAAGEYRLEGLPFGTLTVKASDDELGKVQAELEAVAGQELQWNPVISKGFVFRGRVLDHNGKPIPRAMVKAHVESSGAKITWWAFEDTDTEGRFELKNCVPDRTISIRVHGGTGHGEKRLEGIKPGHEELVIRLEARGKPSIYISGRILDPAGEAVEACSITPYCKKEPSGAVLTTEAGTGAFKYGPYAPGEWQLRINAKGYPIIRTAWHVVGKGETWDLGTIRLQRPGFVQVSLEVAAGELPEKLSLQILSVARQHVGRLAVDGGAGRSGPLAPGAYFLQVRGGNFAVALHEFEIQSGQNTPLQVTMQRGVPVALEFTTRTGAGEQPPPRPVSVTVIDGRGKTLLSTSAYRRRGAKTAMLAFAAKPGKYRVEASTDRGKRAATDITVGVTRGDAVRIVLRD